MKKIIILFVLSFLLFSCFEEKASSDFMNGTEWNSNALGTDVKPDGMKYSYIETHTLRFDKNVYVHILDRQETVGEDSHYIPVGKDTIDGVYIVRYPEIIMTEKGQEKLATVSLDGVLVVDRGNDQPLFYYKRRNK
ncbi:MAG: hypothetical protein LBJ39_03760 [Tannerellaceae bacterium]|jgi:hypothetical protein|nr:hypothetical protein [Tannerellaceae bacterium]